MEELGIEVLELEFTPALRSLTAGQFMHMLAAGYGASLLMLGHDTRFGYRPSTSSPPARMASPFEEYRGYGLSEGIEVVRAPVLPGVSSSAIRRAIGDGDMQGAARMLGRPFTYKAVVMHGRRLGRTIGFPTANLDISDTTLLLPAGGVYAATATLAGGQSYAAMVNIGRRPTVDCTAAPVTMEAYLDGFRGNLYGQTVALAFHRRLRDERRFPSLDDLKNQLAADLKALRGC